PEIVSVLVFLLIEIGARRGVLRWRDPAVIIATSFALSVIVDFNQQIITGRTLQPIHYEWFIANYCAILAVVVTAGSWLRTDAQQPVLWSPRMLVFPAVSEIENRERFWRQLYYLGYDEKKFWAELDHVDWNFLTGMFPYNRLSPAVGGVPSPITPEELRAQLA